MKKKSPGKIRLMGYTRNSCDIRAVHHIKTASSMFMTREERESLESAMDFRALAVDTRRERDKFARQDATVEKFQTNYFKARERLAARINKNRAMMELRHELQRARREKQALAAGKRNPKNRENPDLEGGSTEEAKLPIGRGGFTVVELGY